MAHLGVVVDKILETLNTSKIEDSIKFAKDNNWEHSDVVGAVNQLFAQRYIETETAEVRIYTI